MKRRFLVSDLARRSRSIAKRSFTGCMACAGGCVRAGCAVWPPHRAGAQVITVDTSGKGPIAGNGQVDRQYAQIAPTHVDLPKSELDPKARIRAHPRPASGAGLRQPPVSPRPQGPDTPGQRQARAGRSELSEHGGQRGAFRQARLARGDHRHQDRQVKDHSGLRRRARRQASLPAPHPDRRRPRHGRPQRGSLAARSGGRSLRCAHHACLRRSCS